jgi:hypothetical protein
MKVNIEIDCTPEEARTFMGLPDVSGLHDIYLGRMEGFMKDGITPADMEKLVANWMPAAALGLEQFQKAIWGALGTATGAKGK